MKVSLNWLKRYVDIDVSTEELCRRMTMSGFEVDGVENLADTMRNVVAARLVKLENPPKLGEYPLNCPGETEIPELGFERDLITDKIAADPVVNAAKPA